MTSTHIVPDDLSFEAAITQTEALIAQMEQRQLSEPDLEAAITALVATENGARGFFVTYLTDARSIADQPTAAVIRALRSSPDIVSELLVKNLAMSSAMAITHRRNQNQDLAAGSDRVQSRTLALIQQVQLEQLRTKAIQLGDSAATNHGNYATFLNRWGYDQEQRQVIQQQMQRITRAMGAGV
ncbi:MAG: hypothetical protein MUF72_08910 [Elainella sp. Prado103]|nr:hypothetical protein [Elainella sp. Prado103]